jgi:hypothetical protein
MVLIAFITAFFFVFQIALVAAHGDVSRVILNGKTFQGPNPFSNKNADSPIRKISTTFPITSVTSPDMNCGINAKAAAIVAPVTAGSKVTFAWESGRGKNWGHSIGPIMTYMAKCDGSCKNFDTRKAKFFKVSQVGRKDGSMTWHQADIKAGRTFTTTLPKELPDGEYIIRHELIALHFATKKNGAQMYPSCIQVKVTGGQGKALPTETVSFPGAYKATDPGIFTPNIFTKREYIFPGPAIGKFGAAPRNNIAPATTSNSTTNVNTNSTNNANTTTTTLSSNKGEVHPHARRFVRSRIMRDLPSEAMNH